jgi:hypothetical protein
MANEIILSLATTGLSGLYVRPLQGTTIGASLPLLEISGAGGTYAATMSGAAGTYIFLAFDSSDQKIGASSQSFYWDGAIFADTQSAVTEALQDFDVATEAQVLAAGFTGARDTQLINIENHTRKMAKQHGLVAGISATHSVESIVVSDGDGSTTITDNGDGSFTVAG